MRNGVDLLGAIRTQLQGRDDLLTRSLDQLEREREIIRRELGLIEEVLTLEQDRVASEVPKVPEAEEAPEPEGTFDGEVASEPAAPAMVAVETRAEPEPVTGVHPEIEPEPAAQLILDPTPAEAPDPLLRRVEALQRLRARLVADARQPDPVPPPTLNVNVLRRVQAFQRLGKS
ncbi:MAG TPA: hypothetical protein VN800_00430 [Candidatus Acidoferrales bacterium]|nr:hypothetical protein [Candidatus Acidoferrales bacterium]